MFSIAVNEIYRLLTLLSIGELEKANEERYHALNIDSNLSNNNLFLIYTIMIFP